MVKCLFIVILFIVGIFFVLSLGFMVLYYIEYYDLI